MSTIELISAILLILSCVFIIVIVFFQGSQKGGMSQSITGQSSDNYYQRNMGRSKEMKLKKLTVIAAVFFFVVSIAVNVIAVHFSGNDSPATEPDFDLDSIYDYNEPDENLGETPDEDVSNENVDENSDDNSDENVDENTSDENPDDEGTDENPDDNSDEDEE